MTQLRDRSALVADKARQRSDRAAGRKRAEVLAVMVVCATRVSSSFGIYQSLLNILELPLTIINHTFGWRTTSKHRAQKKRIEGTVIVIAYTTLSVNVWNVWVY